MSNRSKYESVDLSGSVFLVSGDGKIISLPMPTSSSRDPLNWSAWKRTRAFLALGWFSVVGLTLVQGSSLLFAAITTDFSPQVYDKILGQLATEITSDRIWHPLNLMPWYLVRHCSRESGRSSGSRYLLLLDDVLPSYLHVYSSQPQHFGLE